MTDKPKIVLWDLETLPDMDRVMEKLQSYGAWPGRGFNGETNSIICFGYKILGEEKAQSINVWDFEGWEKDINDDTALVLYAYEVLKDADAIVTHNGDGFDIPVFNTRLAKLGLPPLPKMLSIDTKKVAKRRYKFYSNRLGDLANFLGVPTKLKHTGWKMWCDVRKHDRKAMKLMADYCIQDVECMHYVYEELKPAIQNMPNYNFYTDQRVCPNCGSGKLHKHSIKVTKAGKKQRYQCQECGTISQEGTKTQRLKGE